MSFESIQSLPERTPIDRARELAREIWGSEYDEARMRQDGLDPWSLGSGADDSKYRNWHVWGDKEGAVLVTRRGIEYVYDEAEQGFRRVLTDEHGNTRGLSQTFSDSEGSEQAEPKRYQI